VLNFNAAPAADGLLNASVVQVMHDVGKAINETFFLNNAGIAVDASGRCGADVAVVTVNVTGDFDYIVTMEDLTKGQRIGNYTIEYRAAGSDVWEVLVPPVQPAPPVPPAHSGGSADVTSRSGVQDRLVIHRDRLD
jgi:hypothetical protein